MGVEGSFNFRRIDDRLTTSGVVSVADLYGLRAEGYDAVINLLPATHEHAVLDEERIVVDQGLDYVHIPVDFQAPTGADLEAFVEAMDVRSSQKIHVHCAANYRVSAFYALYALRRDRCSDDEADAFIRDVWDLDEHPAWLAFVANERTKTRS